MWNRYKNKIVTVGASYPAECAEYVAHAITDGSAMASNDGGVDESGLFAHQSGHASFKSSLRWPPSASIMVSVSLTVLHHFGRYGRQL